MFKFRCSCNKLLVEKEKPTDRNIKCIRCGKHYMWWNNEYVEFEYAKTVNNFTPREISGLGLHNKIKRGLIW